MLIVIVIIGILTAAIIPRLNSARGRANDVARKADLNQIATALITYQLDNWRFPESTGTTIDTISDELIEGGMTSIPKDPANNKTFSWISNVVSEQDSPYYLYTSIKKNWVADWWFVLMSKMESAWQANYVVCEESDPISSAKEYSDIHLCQTISIVEAANDCLSATETDTSCKWSLDQLRYIYKY